MKLIDGTDHSQSAGEWRILLYYIIKLLKAINSNNNICALVQEENLTCGWSMLLSPGASSFGEGVFRPSIFLTTESGISPNTTPELAPRGYPSHHTHNLSPLTCNWRGWGDHVNEIEKHHCWLSLNYSQCPAQVQVQELIFASAHPCMINLLLFPLLIKTPMTTAINK